MSAREGGRKPDQLRAITFEPDFLENPHGSVVDHAGADEGAVHGDGRRGHPALASRPGQGLDHRGVLAAAGVDRRPRPARGVAREAAGPDDRDPAADRPCDPRGRRLRGARRADDVARLRRPPGRRRNALCGDLRRLCRRPACARPLRPLAHVRDSVAAVSVGVVEGVPLLDLDYSEDSNADTDMNVVMTGDGRLVEVQATAERDPFARETLDELLGLAAAGIARDRDAAGGSGRA